jgi:hypothetical protein
MLSPWHLRRHHVLLTTPERKVFRSLKHLRRLVFFSHDAIYLP